jgi:beta-lactam-binding protein with PASTA domain|tara:strand:+ start:2435 stop:3040 length:606 start_codon:yes stop_codon:yes gene_type:complete
MKKIAINLGIMALIVLTVIFGIFWFLDTYTKHDDALVKIPNLEGVRASRALSALDDLGLQGMVSDTVYKDGAKKLAVINQNPIAGLDVKKGRKVYLVINTGDVPMVRVPDLAEKTSLQQATNILLRSHLKVGQIIKVVNSSVKTKHDEPVLAQYIAGTTEELVPGTEIERNSEVDLVVGITVDYYLSDSTAVDIGIDGGDN